MTDRPSKPDTKQPDALRRKFAKAGVAAPIVLATLASKPVLGAVPWTCTISGQLSGNTSGHESESCTALQDAKTKDVFAADTLIATGDKISDAFPGVADHIYIDVGDGLTTANTGTVATISQILNKPTPSTFETSYELVEYTQKALVLLLNARNIADTSIYPVTEAQATGLFKTAADAAAHPIFHDSDPDVDWDLAHVKAYIDLFF